MTNFLYVGINWTLGLMLIVLSVMIFRYCVEAMKHASRAHGQRVEDKYMRLFYWLDPASMFRDRYFNPEGQTHRRRFTKAFNRTMVIWAAASALFGLILLFNDVYDKPPPSPATHDSSAKSVSHPLVLLKGQKS